MLVCACAVGCGSDRAGLEERCEGKQADACHALGELLVHGIGGPADRKGGRFKLERACELGRADSCRIAAGLSYGRRDKRARRFLTYGCEGGDAESCADLGWMVEHGEGGDEDRDAGQRFYEQACRGGEAAGCLLSGLAWRPGPGGGGDHQKSRDYFRRACELGCEPACGEVGP
jgi:TPR repeat protein